MAREIMQANYKKFEEWLNLHDKTIALDIDEVVINKP
jgi:hypothetical protein